MPPRVFMTRADDTLDPIRARLVHLQADIRGVALIETQARPFALPTPEAGYTTLLLTSVNGVQHFFAQARPWWDALATPPKLIAVGPATAEALQREGLPVAAMPDTFSGLAAVALIRQQAASTGETPCILWPCGNLANPQVKEALEQSGIPWTALEVYRTETPVSAQAALAVALAPPPTVAAFTSPSSVTAFCELADPSVLAASVLIAIGPTTARAIEARLNRECVVAAPHSLEGLASAVEQALIAGQSDKGDVQ